MSADIGYLQIKIRELNDKLSETIKKNEESLGLFNKQNKKLNELIHIAEKDAINVSIIKSITPGDMKIISDYVYSKNMGKAINQLNKKNQAEIQKFDKKCAVRINMLVNSKMNYTTKEVANNVVKQLTKLFKKDFQK